VLRRVGTGPAGQAERLGDGVNLESTEDGLGLALTVYSARLDRRLLHDRIRGGKQSRATGGARHASGAGEVAVLSDVAVSSDLMDPTDGSLLC
jgi:hypothetical protein